ISPHLERFSQYSKLDRPHHITTANGAKISVVGEGAMSIEVPNGPGKTTTITLEKVLHVPDAAFTLVSLRRADERGFTSTIADGSLTL
ncbi:uncharacterized protein BXZ73DRAFT_25917, partial [Epithele typhae]|uniref:uncharacterized protein n=1 Tax=Epithele typhae TaxID=378194 RepID=UPI002007C70A